MPQSGSPMPSFKLFWVVGVVALVALGGLSACAPVKVLNAIAAADRGVAVEAGIAYGPLERQNLDVYTPAGTAPRGGWPVVVFFYGGSWTTGERADYRFVGTALAARGVLTLVADYRLYPAVRYPDFLRDSALALAWGLRESKRLGGDPARVFVMGHSAGGYNAAMLALDPRWLGATGHTPAELAGWIGLAGAYDFLPSTLPDVQQVFMHPNYPPKAEPIELDVAGSPPALLAAPEHDRVVSPTLSTRALAAKLEAAKVPTTLRMYERPTHALLIGAFSPSLRWVAPSLDDVLAFIVATPPVRR